MKASLSAEALADAEQAADWYIEQDAWVAAAALQVEIARAIARGAEAAPPHPRRRISVTFGGTPASFTVTS
jgi:plasmid stabilization system protein ParE